MITRLETGFREEFLGLSGLNMFISRGVYELVDPGKKKMWLGSSGSRL
jgi:hypothetical protein